MTNIKSRMSEWFFDRMATHMPRRTKRLIFLASLTALIKNTTAISHETLKRLNELMAVAQDERAMQLPVELSHGIWCGKNICEVCQRESLEVKTLSTAAILDIAGRIYEAMPMWLRYGRESDIQGDIIRILDNRATLLEN